MYVPPQTNWSNLFVKYPGSEEVKVGVISLGDLLDLFGLGKSNEVGVLLRMDVEGYEYEIFAGGFRELEKIDKLFLSIECHPCYLKDSFWALLDIWESLGLKCWKVLPPKASVYEYFSSLKLLNKLYNKLNEFLNQSLFDIEKVNNLEDLRNLYSESGAFDKYPYFHIMLYKCDV